MRLLHVCCLLFISAFLSMSALAMQPKKWTTGPLTISGQGTTALWVCNFANTIPCWFSRPNSFCELPKNSIYRIKENHKKTKIKLIGAAAEIVYKLTKDCYDHEPIDKKHLRYNYGNKGVHCEIKNFQYRCSIVIDHYYPPMR